MGAEEAEGAADLVDPYFGEALLAAVDFLQVEDLVALVAEALAVEEAAAAGDLLT